MVAHLCTVCQERIGAPLQRAELQECGNMLLTGATRPRTFTIMNNALTTSASPLAVLADEHLVSDWLAAKSVKTRKAYAGDLARFAAWLGVETNNAAAARLLSAGSNGARHLALGYRGDMESRELSPATINRALAALRSLVDLARDAGLVDWTLNVASLKARAYRDTRGPARAAVKAIVTAAADESARDGALIRLLYGLGLRRSEAVELDVCHVDLDGARVFVRGKGQHDRAPLTVPPPVVGALRAWLEVHPDARPDAPLFVAFDNRSHGARLSDRSVARVLARACESAGEGKVAPHALRHAAITHALDATNGDVRKVRAFSRHAKIETLVVYDDNRRDGQGEIAGMVAL